MRNFILFIVTVSVLSFAGFILYRVYYKGESPDAVFQELRGSEEEPDVLAEAKDAYDRREYAEALKGFEMVLDAHESGEPGAKLEEIEHKDLLKRIASCYTHLWEDGGKTDDTLRIQALRVYEKYIEKYPDSRRRHIGRAMGELRNAGNQAPASEKETEVVDESPPK